MARIIDTSMLSTGLALIILQGIILASGAGVLIRAEADAARGDQVSLKRESNHVSGSGTKSRSKRCTCYSYRDKECVYYCHLDIIWINTPEHIVPYGMSSYGGHQRTRRAAGGMPLEVEGANPTHRCTCAALVGDSKCHDFCQSRPLWTVPRRTNPGGLLGWRRGMGDGVPQVHTMDGVHTRERNMGV